MFHLTFFDLQAIFGVVLYARTDKAHNDLFDISLKGLEVWLVLVVVCPRTLFDDEIVHLPVYRFLDTQLCLWLERLVKFDHLVKVIGLIDTEVLPRLVRWAVNFLRCDLLFKV